MNIHSQQHVLVMCATAFYLMENYPLDVGPEFSASVIQVRGLWMGSVGHRQVSLWTEPVGHCAFEDKNKPFSLSRCVE